MSPSALCSPFLGRWRAVHGAFRAGSPGDSAAVRQCAGRRCTDAQDARVAQRVYADCAGAHAAALLFCTLQPELAQAKGVPVRCVSMLFLALVALTVAACTQIVGALLVFILMAGPAAAAQNWTVRWSAGIALAVVCALACAWGGIALAYLSNWPTSFWISVLSALAYGLSLLTGPMRMSHFRNTSD